MFDSWYARKDAELMKGGPEEQLDYAKELLAELLNRAKALENMYYCAFVSRIEANRATPDPGAKMDYEEVSDRLFHAVGVFTHDANEGLARARRARLVYGSDEVAGIHTGSVDEDLEQLGGSLVPWHADEPAPPGYQKVLVIPDENPNLTGDPAPDFLTGKASVEVKRNGGFRTIKPAPRKAGRK